MARKTAGSAGRSSAGRSTPVKKATVSTRRKAAKAKVKGASRAVSGAANRYATEKNNTSGVMSLNDGSAVSKNLSNKWEQFKKDAEVELGLRRKK